MSAVSRAQGGTSWGRCACVKVALRRVCLRQRFYPVILFVRQLLRELSTVAKNPQKQVPFDIRAFLSSAGKARSIAKFKKGQVIFSQDVPCDDVLYIQSGNAKLSIVNPQGKEAVLAIVGPGDFLGEGCIIGNPVRMATATAIAPLNAMSIEKKEMMRVLHDEQEFAGKFIAYMLERNLKTEADLVDQLFNSSEKRLARALLILARYGKAGEPETI